MLRSLMLALLCLLLAPSLPAQVADLILHNGKIVTTDPVMTIHEAVAVSGSRILAVGPAQMVMDRHLANSTEVVDLQGKTVLPGLIDSHVHALSAGLSEFRGEIPPLNSFAAVQQYIRQKMETTPKGEWIVVPRTFPTRLAEMQMPTKEVLDVAPEHPVMFDASYTVVVNSFALNVSGIDRNTPNPERGEIVKGDDGNPNGILKNAQSLLQGLGADEEFSREEKAAALELMLRRYVEAGLTAVGDRAVDEESIELYQQLQAEKRLPIRAVLTWRPGATQPFEDILHSLKSHQRATNSGDEWLKFGPYKVTLDGGMTIGTAFQRHPYGPFGKQLYGMTDPDNRGLLLVGPEKFLGIMRTARDRGWQLTSHCQGGGSIDLFLEVMERLNDDRPIAPTRSHLMHASFQSPDAIEKAAKLGILADVQAPWLHHDGPALTKVFGVEGMEYFIPLRSYIDAGVKLAGGSDHMVGFNKNRAVNPYNPFFQMWMAITREMSNGQISQPEQRINREEALRMHTTWAAYLQFADHERGSIEVGKLADMVVLDRDYLTCPEEQIRLIEPVMTILDGKIVYEQ